MTPETAEQARLEKRSYDGFLRIGEATNDGLNVDNWFDHWVRILRGYEALSDDLATMRPEQVELAGMPRTVNCGAKGAAQR